MSDGANKFNEIIEFGNAIGLADAVPGRYSVLLLIDIYYQSMILGTMNPAKVITEIKSLEGSDSPSRTKPAQPFSGPHLKGLWHKHYLADGLSTMARNLANGLKKYGIPQFEENVRLASEANEERYMTEEDIKLIVHDAVHGNWMRRADDHELTGEWLIYAQHENKNYYLCLGKHTTGDEHIRQQIDAVCCQEFPFLSDLLCSLDNN